MRKKLTRIFVVLALGGASLVATGAAAQGQPSTPSTSKVTTSSLGTFTPTFVGTAATGCQTNCALLTGPFPTGSTASITSTSPIVTATVKANSRVLGPRGPEVFGSPTISSKTSNPVAPTVSCQPTGPGCDSISQSPTGVIGVNGLNAVDSATQSGNPNQTDIEPADQALCAGNGYVVEANNIGELLVFNQSLHRVSSVIPMDTLMGLTSLGWSGGGDVSCLYDASNGGHWFFTEIVSASSEASGGPFAGCFNAVASSCYEGIAVTTSNDPFGPYNVYFANANYNPAEPGYPYQLNDFAKIATTRDAFLLFWDEFPLNGKGLGDGYFNGAQEFAFDKNALELGLPVTESSGSPNPSFNVAIENMGLIPTPDGACSSNNNPFGVAGVTCWYSVIPAQPPDQTQFDNSHGGSGFMLDTLDFVGSGDTRLAVWDWTGLDNLNSDSCVDCGGIQFGGQLFSGVQYYYGEGAPGSQKSGPIPLGDVCGAAGLSVGSPAPASCPEGGIATNGDNVTQASQGNGQLWAAATTEVNQRFNNGPSRETHQGAAYWVIGTNSFDQSGTFSLTSQGYVSAAHEDIEMPSMAAADTGAAIIDFTLSGNGGRTHANKGGFYPSSAYGLFNSSTSGLTNSTINVADLGKSPQDGFTEYLGYPGPTRPRWGDYSNAVFVNGQFYFASNFIPSVNCTGAAFTLSVGTCGGTRDGFANWGTAVNSVKP